MIKMFKKYMFLSVLFCGIIIPFCPLMAADSCTNKCSDVKCTIGTDGSGHLNVLASKNQMDSKCLAKQAADGCFNTVPVGCAGSYAGLGYRPNGAGGNSKPRNHLGSDIGAAACKQNGKQVPINVYAAADGIVKYVNTSTGGGRTIVIEHTKACQGAAEPSYKSTYRHVLQYKVSVGQKVNKGDVIGIMGGSNAGSLGGAPCDNPEQAGWPGYTRAGCSTAHPANYAIHLHFEIEEGKASASSSQASAARAMSPNCNNLQVLCGKCPNNASSCGGSGGGAFTDGSSGDLSGGYSESGSDGSPAGGADVVTSNTCRLEEFLDSKDCIFCNMFRSLYNSASSIAKMANDGLALPSKQIVGIGFLIWLIFYLLKQVSSMGGASIGDMLKGILFQGFRVAVVLIILSNAIYAVMDLTLNPVMQTGMSFINGLDTNYTCPDDAPYMQNIIGYNEGYSGDKVEGGLSIELGKSILCSLKKLEDSTGFMMGLGKYSMCLSFNEYKWAYVLPHFTYLLTGLLLWLAGAFLLFTFPWCLVDCILQMCVAAAMVPCAIAAYAFKITEKYLKIIWNFFMNAMFEFVFMGIIVYIINSQLKDWIGMDLSDSSTFDHRRFTIGIGDNGLAWWGKGFIKIAAVCFFCNTFFEEAGEIAGKFAKSPGLGGNKGIGKMVGGTVQGAAHSLGKSGLNVAAKSGSAIGSAANSLVGNKVRSGINHLKGRAIGLLPKGQKITDDSGNVVGYQRNVRFMGRQISRTITKDENGVWTQVKETKKRSSTDKAFEKVYDENGNELKDANGNTVYRMRHRVFGITTGYEDLTATKNDDGSITYATADGKYGFTMNADGEIGTYKTRFTVNWDNFSRTRAVNPQNASQYQTVRTINDAFSKTTQTLDSKGNAIHSTTLFNNESAKYLVNKDGTINEYAFNQIKNGTQNAETAAVAMVATVMEKRGQKLDSSYKDRRVEIAENGAVIIQQTNNDGSIQLIEAEMAGNQMIIRNSITDSEGNISIQKSNGMQTKTESYRRHVDKDNNVTYDYRSRFHFSDYLQSQNSRRQPLNAEGKWGFNLDVQKVNAGFTEADFKQHIAQLKLQKLRQDIAQTSKQSSRQNKEQQFQADLKNKDSEVYKLDRLINAKELTESAARIHAAKAVNGLGTIQLQVVDNELLNQQRIMQNSAASLQNQQSNVANLETKLQLLQKELQQLKQKQENSTQISQQKSEKELQLKAIQLAQKKAAEDLLLMRNQHANSQKEMIRLQQTYAELDRFVNVNPYEKIDVNNLNYENMIDEISNSDLTPERMLKIRKKLESTNYYADRDADFTFVWNELSNKATQKIEFLATSSLIRVPPERLDTMEKMLDTFISHDSEGNYSNEAANTLKKNITAQKLALGIKIKTV